MAFDSVFVVMSMASNTVVRVKSRDATGLVEADTSFYTLSSSGTGDTPNISTTIITSMCSMDYYGIFLGLNSGTYIVALKPYVLNEMSSQNVIPTYDINNFI